MTKVLVVGGAGYIGGLSSDLLVQNGYDVTIFDILLYEPHYLKETSFVYGDIRNTDELVSVAERFDIIILLAALVGDPACSVDSELAEQINYKAIMDFCTALSPGKHVIFMSTCSVYGAQDGLLTEENSTNPLSVYASTKLAAEKFVLQRGGTVFRLGTVFGLGDTYSRIRLDLVVNILTMKAVKTGEISVNGGGQWRPIISVIDIANFILEACGKKPEGVFILSKENVTIRNLGERVAAVIPGTTIHYTEISFQDARNYRVSTEKSEKYFTYRPKVTVEDEVKRMLLVFKENRIRDLDNILYHNGQYLLKNINTLLK
ncbi:MAG: NAD(P)-dependent oxidoreductase [Bacteroidota bacterium]